MPGPISQSYDPDPRVLTCAFCGVEYPPGTPPTQHEALTIHVWECKKHPLRKRINELEQQAAGSCHWVKHSHRVWADGEWDTGCHTISVNKHKNYLFCPYCGKPITIGGVKE